MEQFQVKGRTLVIRMPKELDHHTTGQIPGIADRMIGEKNIQRIEFDFRDTGFMDSSGIGLVMGRYKLMQEIGGNLVVRNPPPHIKKVMRLSGIDRLASICNV